MSLCSKLSFANSLVAPADQNSAAYPSLAAEAPINAAIATRDAGDVAAKVLFERGRAGVIRRAGSTAIVVLTH